VELFNLGKVPWAESQLIYHALGELNREALSLVSPASPYVCIGFHQDVDQEVDLEYCRAHHIPVFRREVGGGAVFLDGRQLFFQLIIRRDNPLAPLRMESFYRKFLDPVIQVHRRLGIPAEYRPINDLAVHGRKISGTGAAEIGECAVFVGNLILDFDYETMSRVLRVPDEKFREKVKKTIRENLSTIRAELGVEAASRCSDADLNVMMAEEFAKVLGPLKPARVDDELAGMIRTLEGKMINPDWLHRKGKRVPGRRVKVRAGLEVFHRRHQARGGLIRVDGAVADGCYRQVALSGDFLVSPPETFSRLEQFLEGRPVAEVEAVLAEFFAGQDFDPPGVTRDDWLEVLRLQPVKRRLAGS
jgi:lipoate-protein ligase A